MFKKFFFLPISFTFRTPAPLVLHLAKINTLNFKVIFYFFQIKKKKDQIQIELVSPLASFPKITAWSSCGLTVAGQCQGHKAPPSGFLLSWGTYPYTWGWCLPFGSPAKSMVVATSDLFISSGPVALHDCLRLPWALAGSREHSWDLPSLPMWPSLQQTMQNSLLWHPDLPLSLSRLFVMFR